MDDPNYKHRTFVGVRDKAEDFNKIDLIDCIGISVEQAESIILQMQSQYLGNEQKLCDATNFSTLEVIRKELLDIKTIVDWFFDKSKTGESHE